MALAPSRANASTGERPSERISRDTGTIVWAWHAASNSALSTRSSYHGAGDHHASLASVLRLTVVALCLAAGRASAQDIAAEVDPGPSDGPPPALTEAQLKPVIGKLMSGGEIRAIIQRRDRMQQIIDGLVKAKGADAVFIK